MVIARINHIAEAVAFKGLLCGFKKQLALGVQAFNMTFPTPVGGTPLPVDFAPSVLFAVLYGILAPFAIFRFLQRRSRTTLLIGTLAFAIER